MAIDNGVLAILNIAAVLLMYWGVAEMLYLVRKEDDDD